MMEYARLLWDAVALAIRNPAANPTVSALIMSAIFLVALIAVLGLLFILTPSRRRVVKVRRYRVSNDDDTPSEGVPEPEPILLIEGASATTVVDAGDAAESVLSSENEGDTSVGARAEGSEDAGRGSGAARGRLFASRSALVILSTPVLILMALVSGYLVTGTNQYCSRVCHAGQPKVSAAVDVNHSRCVTCHEEPGISGIVTGVLGRAGMAATYIAGGRPDGSALVSTVSCMSCHEKGIR
ncbi:MAG: hypothetical protein Q8S43_04660, partial [Actinomycetota bacterium]|nr:hypothetical protein [Actinomycetota bacterium]